MDVAKDSRNLCVIVFDSFFDICICQPVFPLGPIWFSLLCCQFSLNFPKHDSGFPLNFPPNFIFWFSPKFYLKRSIFFSKTSGFEFNDEMKEMTAKTKGLFLSKIRVFNFQTATKTTEQGKTLPIFKKEKSLFFGNWKIISLILLACLSR